MTLHEGCEERGGICDCGPRPCVISQRESTAPNADRIKRLEDLVEGLLEREAERDLASGWLEDAEVYANALDILEARIAVAEAKISGEFTLAELRTLEDLVGELNEWQSDAGLYAILEKLNAMIRERIR